MTLTTRYPDSLERLCELVQSGCAFVPASSRTSTVVDFENLERNLIDRGFDDVEVLDLSKMPGKVDLLKSGNVRVRGAVDWKELRQTLRAEGRDIKVAPTEESANVLAGVVTSATGENSFGFGPFRDHVVRLSYVNVRGEVKHLDSSSLWEEPEIKELDDSSKQILKGHQKDYLHYENFKNAPFPRLEKQIDLMIGTEGQLGIVVEAEIETRPFERSLSLALPLPRWEEDLRPHEGIFKRVQHFRDDIISCELIDYQGLTYLRQKGEIEHQGDLILLEVREEAMDKLVENLFQSLEFLDLENIFELSENERRQIRMAIPRWVQELNAREGIVKKGTDAQFSPNQFQKAFDCYRELAKDAQCSYTLFGHFGDNHLHFNFLPQESQLENCQERLEDFYQRVLELKGSPFAEHGIGVIKLPFVESFWTETHRKMFAILKETFDPQNRFFPMGFMTYGQKGDASE